MKRCSWSLSSEKMKEYHDKKWGKPEHNDIELFAMLCLEGAQAGLSWSTILDREENYRKAFDGFDVDIVSEYSDEKIQSLFEDDGIIRNKLKIRSVITNAKAFKIVQKEFGSFDTYFWGFTNGEVLDAHYESEEEIPAQSELSVKISKDLKKRGFKFVGPTIVYAYMQAIGMVNDHIESCDFR